MLVRYALLTEISIHICAIYSTDIVNHPQTHAKQEIKNDIPALLDNLRGKCVLQAKGISLGKTEAALFLWDQAMKNKKAGEELNGGQMASAVVKALEEGSRLDKATSAGLLAHITKTEDARTYMVQYGVVPELSKLLSDDESPTASTSAAAALHNLAQTPDVRKRMVQELDFKTMVEAARPNPSKEVTAREPAALTNKRADAANCLHLCMDPERNADHKWVRERVIAADGLSAFEALLQDGRTVAGMEAAAWCLAHVAYEEDQKDGMLASPGLMRNLVRALKSKEITSLKLKGGAAAVFARLTSSAVPSSDVETNLRLQARQLAWQVSQPGAKELSNYAEQKELLNETQQRVNGIMLGPMTGVRRNAADATQARVQAAIELGALEPLVNLLKPPTEEQLEAAGMAGEGGEKGKAKGKKKKGKAPPLPPGMLECYLYATTALRRMSFDRGALDGLREAAASGLLVALLEQPDHRVRRNAESTLQNMGFGTVANVPQLQKLNAPERHFRLPLPGVALSDLDLPARSQARLDRLLPGVSSAAAGSRPGTGYRPITSAPPSSLYGLDAPRAHTPGAPGAPRPPSIQ